MFVCDGRKHVQRTSDFEELPVIALASGSCYKSFLDRYFNEAIRLLCVSSGTNDTALRRQVGSVRLGKQVCSAYALSSVSMAGSAVGSSTQKRRAISCLKKCCLVSELRCSLEFCNCWGQSRPCRTGSHTKGTRNGRRHFRLEIRNTCG